MTLECVFVAERVDQLENKSQPDPRIVAGEFCFGAYLSQQMYQPKSHLTCPGTVCGPRHTSHDNHTTCSPVSRVQCVVTPSTPHLATTGIRRITTSDSQVCCSLF